MLHLNKRNISWIVEENIANDLSRIEEAREAASFPQCSLANE